MPDAEDIARDGRRLGRKRLKESDPSVAIAVYLPESVKAQIDAVAAGNVSAWLRKAIVHELARDGSDVDARSAG